MKFRVASLLILVGGMAHAGGTFDSTGTITGQSTTKLYPVGEGQMVMEVTVSHDVFDMATEGHPFSGMSGTCTGGAQIRGPALTGSGVCQYSNESGDMAFLKWDMDSLSPEGATMGGWTMIGGTGTHAGISGGGRFVSATNRETGAVSLTLDGAVSLP